VAAKFTYRQHLRVRRNNWLCPSEALSHQSAPPACTRLYLEQANPFERDRATAHSRPVSPQPRYLRRRRTRSEAAIAPKAAMQRVISSAIVSSFTRTFPGGCTLRGRVEPFGLAATHDRLAIAASKTLKPWVDLVKFTFCGARCATISLRRMRMTVMRDCRGKNG